MRTSCFASSFTSLASFNAATGLPMFGPAPPTFEVVKKVGSIGSKSRSSRMRSINTEPTMPRQPMNPTDLMCTSFVIPDAASLVIPDAATAALIRDPVTKCGYLSERFDHGRTHLGRGHRFRLGRSDVARAKPGSQG